MDCSPKPAEEEPKCENSTIFVVAFLYLFRGWHLDCPGDKVYLCGNSVALFSFLTLAFTYSWIIIPTVARAHLNFQEMR